MKHPIAAIIQRAGQYNGWLRTIRLTRLEAAQLHAEMIDIGNTETPASMTVWLRNGGAKFRRRGAVITVTWPTEVKV